MRTSAGSLALADMPAPADAFVVQRLRAAGAIILGKTNCSEWANFRSSHSTSGWSGRGGQTRNPYALNRNPCGSSSGTGAAISANFAMVGVGTETDGSVVCPSTANGLVGLKPTVGLVSRAGIIPISASQDTAGPMTRTVQDAAILLNAMIGIDPADPATASVPDGGAADFTTFLSSGGLGGARLGVMRRYFGGLPALDQLMEALARRAARCWRGAGGSGGHRDGAQARRTRVRGPPVRVQGRHQPLPRRPGRHHEIPHARRPDRVQHRQRGRGRCPGSGRRPSSSRRRRGRSASRRTGAPLPTAGASPGPKGWMRRSGAIDSTPSSVPPADRPGRLTW